MNDKELIIKLAATEAAKIGKVVFPSMPIQAMETLLNLGMNNQITKYEKYIDFFFDVNGNLPSPEEFWQVSKSVLDDKPIIIPLFGQIIKINGNDIDELRRSFNTKKQ